MDTDGAPRPVEQAAVAELTGLLPPTVVAAYPTDTRSSCAASARSPAPNST